MKARVTVNINPEEFDSLVDVFEFSATELLAKIESNLAKQGVKIQTYTDSVVEGHMDWQEDKVDKLCVESAQYFTDMNKHIEGQSVEGDDIAKFYVKIAPVLDEKVINIQFVKRPALGLH